MQDDDGDALIGELFARLTAKFEDAAALAADGQVPVSVNVADLIEQLSVLSQEARGLIDAIMTANAREVR